MANTLTRFGQYCRALRIERDMTMADQALAFDCPTHFISSIELGREAPTEQYLNQFRKWLTLSESEYGDLIKRIRGNVVELRRRREYSNNTTAMRLFRKISKMTPEQIRRFGGQIEGEAKDG
jgi:transcriptional regulator with XRE-family HTH domain